MSGLVPALALTLLHFLWQGAVLGVLVALARPALARAPAWLRYASLFGLLLGSVVVVAITLAHELAAVSTSFARPVPGSSASSPWPVLVVLAWASGASALSLRTVWAFARLRALRRTGLPLLAWTDSLTRLARRMGVGRAVALCESPAVAAPVLIGWWRPMILVPLGMMTRLSPEQVEAVLAHELAHVRRWDALLNLVQSAVEILLFFHPVIWWISSQIREAREACCDDLVVDALGEPLQYALALTELEASRTPAPALSMAANRGSLMHRIQHIVARTPRPVRTPVRSGLTGLVVSLSVVATLACAAQEIHGADSASPAEQEPVEATEATASDEQEASAAGLRVAWLPEPVAAFEEQILQAASKHGVDPALVAIVVMVESGGRPTVQSPAGARGLMQVMPATAARIAAQRGLSDHDETRLDDPAYNLDLGTWYLARQLETFGPGRDEDEAIELAAAAYNAGPDALQASLRGEAELREETVRYKSIVRALWQAREQPSAPPARVNGYARPMSWIDELPEDHARARLERSLKGAVDPELGRPANVIKAHGLLPPVLDAHMALYRRVVKAAEVLPQSLREGVAVAVSARNDCFYCSIHHRVSMVRALEREGSDIDGRRLGNALIGHGRRREPLPGNTPDRLVAMVEYAMHLTETPGAMTPEHLAPVRAVGLRDVEIAELNQVVAYFNYVNRIVMGLGVQLEPEYQQSWTDGVIW